LLLSIHPLPTLTAQLSNIQIILPSSELKFHAKIFFLHKFRRIFLQLFCQFWIVVKQRFSDWKQLVINFNEILWCFLWWLIIFASFIILILNLENLVLRLKLLCVLFISACIVWRMLYNDLIISSRRLDVFNHFDTSVTIR